MCILERTNCQDTVLTDHNDYVISLVVPFTFRCITDIIAMINNIGKNMCSAYQHMNINDCGCFYIKYILNYRLHTMYVMFILMLYQKFAQLVVHAVNVGMYHL